MNKAIKSILFIIISLSLFIPFCVSAQNHDQIFEARVVKILKEKQVTREDGSSFIQQDLLLRGLNLDWQDKEFTFQGIGDYEVVSQNQYQVGNRVIVAYSQGSEGDDRYYIVDYVRRPGLYWLGLIFVLLVTFVARWKGIRALVGLLVSFLVIMYIIVPRILAGTNPLLISILGSIIILLAIVYLTEGFRPKSHLAILSIIISLFIVGILSILFSNLTKLTGLAQEEAMFLIGCGQGGINFQGLLLAGIIISTLGVLDDMVISQISSVEQIKKVDPSLANKEVYKGAMRVGVSHLGSMVNTLFLVYAGAALPLLLLFTVNEPPFLTFGQIINQEILATEIIRTLLGSIGLVLSVPIATFLAACFLKHKRATSNSQQPKTNF